jgi:adenosylcobinamide kinase / adenosylcobinamide-phosphate guanylyltransferase
MTSAVLILGGARSGKSMFAEKMARDHGGILHYVATGRAYDDEMRQRIATHRDQRGSSWVTHEEPLDLVGAIAGIDNSNNTVLIDCLTLWITNLMLEERNMREAFDALAERIEKARARLYFVSNEVGMGIVPDNAMAREFRDHAGRLHQEIAAIAGEVYLVAAGLPLKIKG